MAHKPKKKTIKFSNLQRQGRRVEYEIPSKTKYNQYGELLKDNNENFSRHTRGCIRP